MMYRGGRRKRTHKAKQTPSQKASRERKPQRGQGQKFGAVRRRRRARKQPQGLVLAVSEFSPTLCFSLAPASAPVPMEPETEDDEAVPEADEQQKEEEKHDYNSSVHSQSFCCDSHSFDVLCV